MEMATVRGPVFGQIRFHFQGGQRPAFAFFFAPANFPRKVAAVRATPHSETGGGTQLKQCPNSASYTSTGKAKTDAEEECCSRSGKMVCRFGVIN